MKNILTALALTVLSFSFLACSKKAGQESVTQPEPPSLSKGELIYKSTCTSCHSANPKENGPVGPKLFGAKLELLSAKVIRGEYPTGYTALRSTRVMPKFVHLEKDLKSLELYLNQ